MTEKKNKKVKTVSTTSPTVEETTNQQQQIVDKNLITLKGYTTSQINQALKADNPYPARVFLKVEKQEQDIPIFFRIKDCKIHSECLNCPWGFQGKGDWIRPKIKTGSLIEIKGQWADNKEYFPNCKMRKSFTACSYKLISCPWNQAKPYHCPVDCPCEKGKELKAQEVLKQTKKQFPHLKEQVEKISQQVKDLKHE